MGSRRSKLPHKTLRDYRSQLIPLPGGGAGPHLLVFGFALDLPSPTSKMGKSKLAKPIARDADNTAGTIKTFFTGAMGVLSKEISKREAITEPNPQKTLMREEVAGEDTDT